MKIYKIKIYMLKSDSYIMQMLKCRCVSLFITIFSLQITSHYQLFSVKQIRQYLSVRVRSYDLTNKLRREWMREIH